MKKWVRIGAIGTAVTAVCCVTPVLVLLLAALGGAALTVYLDAVLFPLLAFFAGLTVWAVWRMRRGGKSLSS